MKELFEKVYIKSEADLPKDEGMYFIYEYKTIMHKAGKNTFKWDNDIETKELWLEYIDWYLRPVEQTPAKEMPSEKDALNAYANYFDEFAKKMIANNLISKRELMDYRSIELTAWMSCFKWLKSKLQ